MKTMNTEPRTLKGAVAGDDDPALYTAEPFEVIHLTGPSSLTARGLRAVNGDSIRSATFMGIESLDDEAVRVIASWPKLEELRLNGCDGVTSAGVATLARSRSLRRLDLAWSYAVGDDALPPLEKLSLSHLDLTSCNITGTGVETIARFTHLEWLVLPIFAEIGDDAIERLSTTASPIRTLVYGGDVTPRSLQALAKLPALREIGLGGRDRSYPDEAYAEAVPSGAELTFL